MTLHNDHHWQSTPAPGAWRQAGACRECLLAGEREEAALARTGP